MIETIGKIVCLYYGLKMVYWVVKMLTAFGPYVKPVDFGKYGAWTIVTGGTDGIGREYVRQLASLGQNVIVLGRNQQKLESVKSEVEELKVECRTIKADLSLQVDIEKAHTDVGKLCEELDIGMLVNNAGVSYQHADFYHDLSPQKLDVLVDVNCSALMMITQSFIRQRVEKKKAEQVHPDGVVVNISSTFGVIPAPFFSLYGGCKAFVRHFSKSILHEYSGHNIIVQCVMPGMVATKMTGVKKTNFMAPTPKRFVQDALCSISRLSETNGYIGHEIQTLTFKLFPGNTLGTLMGNRFKAVRDRFYAKQKKN